LKGGIWPEQKTGKKGYKEPTRRRKIDRTIMIGDERIGATGSGCDFPQKTLTRRGMMVCLFNGWSGRLKG